MEKSFLTNYTAFALKNFLQTIRSGLFDDQRLRLGWRVLLFVSLVILIGGISLIPLVALILATWVMTGLVDRRPITSVGLLFNRATFPEMMAGVGFGALWFSLIFAVLFLLNQSEWMPGFMPEGVAQAVFVYVVIHISVALLEELLIRGYLLQTLSESVGEWPALLITSLGFALFHLDNPNVNPISIINLSLAGLMLGAMVLKNKTLWAAIGFHFSWNFTQGFIFGSPVSGVLFDDYFQRFTLNGPDWLTGGDFGPEASLLTTVMLGMATFWILRSYHWKPSEAAFKSWNTHVRPHRKWQVALSKRPVS